MVRIATVESVQRHPVRAFDEDLLAIDHKDELARPVRIGCVGQLQLDRPEAVSALPPRLNVPVPVDQLQLDIIERGFAGAPGPPEVDRLEITLDLAMTTQSGLECS